MRSAFLPWLRGVSRYNIAVVSRQHTNEDLDPSIIDSPSSSDAEFPSDSSSDSFIYPRAIISAGGLVFSGILTFIRSLGPISVDEDGDSNGSSILLSPVSVLK